MRLRADGHAELRVVGPAGVAAGVGALRQLLSWRHPTLFVDELNENDGGPAYSDDLVDVVAVWPGATAWAPPRAWGVGGEEEDEAETSSSSSTSTSSSSSSAAPDPTYDLLDAAWGTPVYVQHPPAEPAPTARPLAYVAWVRPARAAVVVLDAPDASIVSHPLAAWLANPQSPVATVVHVTPADVASAPAYLTWAASLTGIPLLASIPPGPPARALGHLSSARVLARLARVDEGLFRVPGVGDEAAAGAVDLPKRAVAGRLLLKVVGTSNGDAALATIDDTDCVPEWDPEAAVDDDDAPPPPKRARPVVPPPPAAVATTNSNAAAALRARLGGKESSPPPAPTPQTKPTLTFLGTGSAEPSPHRGASGVHVALPSGAGLLLDAGEGTVGALRRALGSSAADESLRRLALLWLSHRHADHVLGATGVLEARARLGASSPLTVLAPTGVLTWLKTAAAVAAIDPSTFTPAPAAGLYAPSSPASAAVDAALAGDGVRVTLVPAAHCRDAHSAVLRSASWSLAHSGDTAPTPALATAARCVDAIIHEATFADCEADHAARKRHATTGGALGVAAAANAGVTLLTHFSQRYPGLPPDAAADPQRMLSARAVAAFDGMRLSLNDCDRAIAATVAAAGVLGGRRRDEDEDVGSGYESD